MERRSWLNIKLEKVVKYYHDMYTYEYTSCNEIREVGSMETRIRGLPKSLLRNFENGQKIN